jgi:hypothetical protein
VIIAVADYEGGVGCLVPGEGGFLGWGAGEGEAGLVWGHCVA